MQDAAGEHLDAGATFAQVLDLSSAVVNVAIPQADALLMRPCQTVAIKLDSYPQLSWHGRVSIVSSQFRTLVAYKRQSPRTSPTNRASPWRSEVYG